MRVLALGILAAIGLAACTQEEGAVNKARVTPRDQVIQEQQRQQERDRVIQEQRQTLPPATR
jgi:uncharacterized lipoprotein YbaY